jgi:hypothetical protein
LQRAQYPGKGTASGRGLGSAPPSPAERNKCTPTGVDPHIAADGPTEFLQPLQEQRTHAKRLGSLDHLVSPREQNGRHCDTESLGGLEMLWGRDDEIASIGRLLTERWLIGADVTFADGAH